MDDLILRLGENFRGLFKSKERLSNGFTTEGWSVTYVFEGDLVETPIQGTARDAMEYALQSLKMEVEPKRGPIDVIHGLKKR